MSIVGDWKERYPRKSGKSRVIFYLFLLAFIIFLILKTDTFVDGFTRIFFSPDSTDLENTTE